MRGSGSGGRACESSAVVGRRELIGERGERGGARDDLLDRVSTIARGRAQSPGRMDEGVLREFGRKGGKLVGALENGVIVYKFPTSSRNFEVYSAINSSLKNRTFKFASKSVTIH